MPTFGTGIHIMKLKWNFEGMVRRQESAGVCAACRFQEGKWGVEAAFQATCNAWHVCCCNCANVCGCCCIWRTSLAFPCALALLRLCPACCCTATAYAAPLLQCTRVHEGRQQQRHMQLLAAVTCNIRSRAAVTTCNSLSAAPRMHARRRFKWGTVQAVSQGLSAGVGVHTRQAGEVRHGVQLFVLWCMRGKLKRGQCQ